LQGNPRTENDHPAGGKVPASVYHDKGHFTPMPETRPMPTKGK
jgi:hypothetical protein